MERHEIEDATADPEVLADLQAKCPEVPLQILEAVAKLPQGQPREWTVEVLERLQRAGYPITRRAAAAELQGMFLYAFSVGHVSGSAWTAATNYTDSFL